MKRRFFSSLVVMVALVLAACSGKHEVKPADPPSVKNQLKLEKLWSRKVGHGVGDLSAALVPEITEQAVYLASIDGEVMAIDRATGKKRWETRTGVTVSAGVSAGYGVVVLGSANGELLVLDQNTGEERWRAELSSEMTAPAAISSTLIIAQTQDGHVSAWPREPEFAQESGEGDPRQVTEPVWEYETSIPVLTLRGSSRPQILANRVYCGFANGKLAALDLLSGTLVWETRVATAPPSGKSELDRLIDVDGDFLMANGVIYTAAYQGNLMVIDPETGRSAFEEPLSTYRGLAAGFGHIYAVDDTSAVVAVDERSGKLRWKNDRFFLRELTTPATFGNQVFVGDFEGYLYGLAQADGELVFRKKIDRKGIQAVIARPGDALYVFGKSGKLVAYRVEVR